MEKFKQQSEIFSSRMETHVSNLSEKSQVKDIQTNHDLLNLSEIQTLLEERENRHRKSIRKIFLGITIGIVTGLSLFLLFSTEDSSISTTSTSKGRHILDFFSLEKNQRKDSQRIPFKVKSLIPFEDYKFGDSVLIYEKSHHLYFVAYWPYRLQDQFLALKNQTYQLNHEHDQEVYLDLDLKSTKNLI